MKSFFSLIFLSLLFLATYVSQAKDSVIIITRPPSPERLAQIKAKKDSLAKIALKNQADSSRFVKRAPKNIKDIDYTKSSVYKINKMIYGSYTDYIANYIKNYHANHGERLARIQSNNRAYFKLIDNVMKRYNVPKEMKSLAIIESAMNCNAVSPVGAVGPWQFMAPTAKMLGLRVDESIDERRDFYKSTNAAARYLKKLHSMFNDWLLVIASYNCGPAPVLRAINSGKGRSFWDIKSKLPAETQNHVMAFIATSTYLDKFSNVLNMGAFPKDAILAKDKKTTTDKDNQPEKDVASIDADDEKSTLTKPQFTPEELSQMAVLKVKGTYNLTVISNILDEDLIRLKRWNPNFDQDIKTAQAPIHLRIPIAKIEQFIIQKENIVSLSAKTPQ